ncbi:MAG: polysaccharide export protein, partial [Planctomycetota bacterium]
APQPLAPAEEAFWFGPRGAPPPLGRKPLRPAAPSRSGDEPAEPYRLGAGDVLVLRIPEDETYDTEAEVTPDGRFAVPLLGGVRASGKTLDELRRELQRGFARYLRRATVTLTLKKARPAAQQVVVVGPVERPGRVELSGQRTLLDVLGVVGYGGKASQQRDRITVLRQGRSLTLWARDVLALRDPRWNLRLRADDVVLVHLPEQATVSGEVVRPGAVDLPPGGTLPVAEAIARSGGVTDKADLRRVRVLRDWGRRVEVVDLNPVLFAGAAPPAPLRPGDGLTVPAGKPTGVYVFGMVETPGLQRFSGRVSLAAAVAQASPKQFGALLEEAKVVRGWPEDPEVIAVDLERLLLDHDQRLDIELRDGDVVYIPETTLSDVLDVLARVLGPLSGPASGAGSVISGVNAR